MFESANLKLERADHHILNLQSAFDAFVRGDAYTIGTKENPETGSKMATIRFQDRVPPNISLILGDAIHNLRTVLDHATWELIGHDRGKQHRALYFPKGADKASYEGTCKGIETPRSDTTKFLIALAAYEGGAGQDLYRLNLLDNSDKHHVIISVARSVLMPSIQMIGADGTTLIEIGGSSFVGGKYASGFKTVPPGATVQFDKNGEPAIDISFGKAEPFPCDPVIPTLLHLANAVGETLGKFIAFVRDRP